MKLFLLAIMAVACVFNIQAAPVEREVTFFNGDIKLGGTLTLPDSVGTYPALLLVSGSGQQNRDEEMFGFKPFKVIAEFLCDCGYAVLRYDDRGVGKSKNKKSKLDSATTEDFAQDAYAGIKFLKTEPNIAPTKIGILGHSEGGIIAAMLAAKHPQDIAFIITMGGPAIPGSKIVNYQVATSSKEVGFSQQGIDIAISYQNKLYQAFADKKSAEDIQEILYQSNLELIEYMPNEKKSSITNKEEYAKSMAFFGVKQANTPWFKFFALFDPATALANVQCPTLAIFGEKDTQVPPTLNLEPYKQAFATKPQLLEIRIINSANHLFQKANTGSISEYATLEKAFTPDFLPTIQDWLEIRLGNKQKK